MAEVLLIMGSDSDLPVMSEAAKMLDYFKIEYTLTIVSAHRTPDRMFNTAKEALNAGYKVIIAGAGGAAHLPGMVAAITPLPVIGVPVKSANMNGLDSLYSIVQMPPGIPVATMAINGAKNAGIMAAKMIGAFDKTILQRVIDFGKEQEFSVMEKTAKLERIGFKDYLENAE